MRTEWCRGTYRLIRLPLTLFLGATLFLGSPALDAATTRLYLAPDGYLKETPPKRAVVRFPIRRKQPKQWRYVLTGSLSGATYGFQIYAQNLSAGDVSASVEILLEHSGEETLLASWPEGLGQGEGPTLFSGSQQGAPVDGNAGDVLVLRISATGTGSFHGYGSVFLGGRFPSFIEVPNLSSWTDSDVQVLEGRLDPVVRDLQEIRSQQTAILDRIHALSQAVSRLEDLLLTCVLEGGQGPPQPEPPGSTPGESPPGVFSLRFIPSTLVLPAKTGTGLRCIVDLGTPEQARKLDLSSLALNLLKGTIRPNPDSCPDLPFPGVSGSRLTVCFSQTETAAPFQGVEAGTLILSAELTGNFQDETPFTARGILRIVRSPSSNVHSSKKGSFSP